MLTALTDNDYLKSIWVALTRLEGLLATPATAAPLPNIVVSPPDLSEIVTAVTGLRPSVTAEEIAQAVGKAVGLNSSQNGTQAEGSSVVALQEVAEALKKLEFRLKGMGTQAYGGGAVDLSAAAIAAIRGGGSSSSTPVVIDSNNSTTAVLAAGATFTGAATNISNYSQINLTLSARPSVVKGDGSNAMASLFFEFSSDATNWDISVPILVRDPGLFIPYPLINVGLYFRVRYINDGGTAAIAALGASIGTAGTPTLQTAFRFTTYLLPQATKELGRTLDQAISGSDPVSVTGAVLMARPTGSDTAIDVQCDTSGNVYSTLTPSVTAAGLLTYRNAALSTTVDAVKASTGRLYGFNAFNPGAALAYLHFFDVAAGSVVLGTTVPKLSFPLPSNTNASIGVEDMFAVPVAFNTAVTVAASTTPGGNSAPASALVVNLFYV